MGIAARIVGVGLGAIALSGCFEMKQDFHFDSDGTASVNVRFAIDAALLALAQQGESKSWCRNDSTTPAEDGVTRAIEASTEGGDSVCVISISGPADAVFSSLNEKDALPNQAAEKEGTFELSEEGGIYTLFVEIPSMKPPEPEEENPFTESMEAMFLSKMSGRVLSWSVSAPHIIETTGDISEDGTLATYSRPLAEAYTSDDPTTFRVVFSLGEPSLLDRVIGIFR